MSDLNRVELIGNLGKDPEILKETFSGCFVRFSVATARKYRNVQKVIIEDTDWHAVYLSNGLGKKAASYARKGSRVYISGELRAHDWTDEAGQIHHSLAIYANRFELLAKLPEEDEALSSSEVVEEEKSAKVEKVRKKFFESTQHSN